MRLKAGRPDLSDYTRYFDAPEAKADAPLTVAWAGVTTLLVDDGSSALMTDGFFSRPGLAAVGLRQIAPSAARIDGGNHHIDDDATNGSKRRNRYRQADAAGEGDPRDQASN